jgi:Domain of unknown function (DUF1840)
MSTLITFKSRASADITMVADTARTIMSIIGKPLGERGVITIEELPEALARLDAAMHAGKDHEGDLARRAAGSTPHSMADEPEEQIAIDQRAWPMREMLRASQVFGSEVVWGL